MAEGGRGDHPGKQRHSTYPLGLVCGLELGEGLAEDEHQVEVLDVGLNGVACLVDQLLGQVAVVG